MTAVYPGAIVGLGQNDFVNWNELGSTTLAAQLNAGATTATLASGTNVTAWPTANFEIRVDNEVIFVGARSGTALSGLVRGRNGTTDATHLLTPTPPTVRVVMTARVLTRIIEEIIALQAALGVNLANVADTYEGETAGAYVETYVLKGTTTLTATPTEIFIGGVASTRIAVPADTVAYVDVRVACITMDAAPSSGAWDLKGSLVNDSGTVDMQSNVGNPTVTILDRAVDTWDVTINKTGASVKVIVTGDAASTIKWIAFATVMFVKQA